MKRNNTRNKATPRTNRRPLSQSCGFVARRIQAIQDDATARLDEAGDLRSAMEARIAALSELKTSLLEAGAMADEMFALCAIVDARKHLLAERTSTAAFVPIRDAQAVGGTAT